MNAFNELRQNEGFIDLGANEKILPGMISIK